MTKTVVFSVRVHSCLVQFNIRAEKFLTIGNKYLMMASEDERDVWYRLLPKRCNCRKMVTKIYADDLVSTGQAQPIWRFKRHKIEMDYSSIWMAQQRQVPRIDLISKADIERMAIDQNQDAIDYVEEVHRMYMENRAKLIVPFKEETDTVSTRLLFCFSPDMRTKGGYAL